MAAVAIAGCGGGGGGGDSTPPPPATYTITGQLYNHGAPAAGVPVTFDGLAATATTTNATGNYTITLPKTAVTGSDHVTFVLSSGATPVNAGVTEVSGVPQNVGRIYVINGTLLYNSSPQSGLAVSFNNNASASTTTDGNGKFAVLVPQALVTGTDKLYIVLVPGNLPATQPVTEISGVPQDFGTKDLGLPGPPPV